MTDVLKPGIPSPDGAADLIDTDYTIGYYNKVGSLQRLASELANL